MIYTPQDFKHMYGGSQKEFILRYEQEARSKVKRSASVEGELI